MLYTPKLSHSHAREVSRAPLDAHEGNTEQTNTTGLSLPSNNTPLGPLSPINGTQAALISQPTISVPGERKIKSYGSSDPIPTHKAHRLISSNDTQVTTEPPLQHVNAVA